MYRVPNVIIPEGRRFAEYSLELAKKIKRNEDSEKNLDTLFKLCYPLLLTEAYKYRNLRPLEELTSDIGVAFMQTVRNFNPFVSNASFIGYCKLILKTEIVKGYYGKYVTSEDRRRMKRFAESTMESLDLMIFYAVDGMYTKYDLLEDPDKLEHQLDYILLMDDIYAAIDEVFSHKKSGMCGERSERTKKVFIDYVVGEVCGRRMRYLDIAKKHGISINAVCNTIYRYKPAFRMEMKKLGYNV